MQTKSTILLTICWIVICISGCGIDKNAEIKDNQMENEVNQTEQLESFRIITQEDIDNIASIKYYNCDKEYMISDNNDILDIAKEIVQIVLSEDDVIPQDEWIEGGIIVELHMKNGNIVEFGCAPNYIGYDRQYDIQSDLYTRILEKGFCVEE